jgi:predicted enzyme related to lactoylglutathione lyase
VWNALLAWALACTVLLFPITALLWRILPKLQFMQFPWRWLLCLSMILSILVCVGLRRWWWRAAVCALSILVIVVVWHRIQTPWWDTAGDFYEMQDNMESGAGYEGVDEYTPAVTEAGAIDGVIDKDARSVTVNGPAHAAIHVARWDAESKTFTAEMSAGDQLALRLLNYPAWRVDVNGREVETAARADSGQMLVPVEAGMNRVQVTFLCTWDRTAGGWISSVTLLGLGGWFLVGRARGGRRA